MITVVIAEDQQIVREGLLALLATESDLQVVGEAQDGIDAITIVEKLKPDILLLDIGMPGLNGLDVTRQLGRRVTETKIIILSSHGDETMVRKGLQYGAAAYLLKASSADELVRAIREVQQGNRYLSAPLVNRAIEYYVTSDGEHYQDPYEQLTDREREIFQLVAEGNSSNEIANRLSISPRTVETHRTNLMRKLDMKSQSDIIRFAIRRGILSIDP